MRALRATENDYSTATRALTERAFMTVTDPREMHWSDGADHMFHVLTSSGRTDASVLDEVGEVSARWLLSLTGP